MQSCAKLEKKPEFVHGDKPLIDTAKIIEEGGKDMDKKVLDGPKPYDAEFTTRADKRKTITDIYIGRSSFRIDSPLGGVSQDLVAEPMGPGPKCPGSQGPVGPQRPGSQGPMGPQGPTLGSHGSPPWDPMGTHPGIPGVPSLGPQALGPRAPYQIILFFIDFHI